MIIPAPSTHAGNGFLQHNDGSNKICADEESSAIERYDQLAQEQWANSIRGCLLSEPGRGDCEHACPITDSTKADEYGVPEGWCIVCHLQKQLHKAETKLRIVVDSEGRLLSLNELDRLSDALVDRFEAPETERPVDVALRCIKVAEANARDLRKIFNRMASKYLCGKLTEARCRKFLEQANQFEPTSPLRSPLSAVPELKRLLLEAVQHLDDSISGGWIIEAKNLLDELE